MQRGFGDQAVQRVSAGRMLSVLWLPPHDLKVCLAGVPVSGHRVRERLGHGQAVHDLIP